ncbi:MAG: hypothetical protein HY653_04845, partial [Acidobacteria bacterium]|nr:hypothetical protein [Acidobacteriota bacterium]
MSVLCLASLLLAIDASAQTSELSGVWAALSKPAFDPNQVATAENVRLERDVATLVLSGGRLALAQAVEGKVFAAAFKGQGRLRLAPTLPLEQQQLSFHSGQSPLEAEFTEALFLFSDSTLDDITRQVNFQSGDVSEFQKLFWDRNEDLTRYGLNWEPRVLKGIRAERPERHAFFVAELKTRDHGWLSLIVDEADPEQVELAKFEPSWRVRSIWAKFPKEGHTPQEAFADPVAHHEYRIERYRLNVTVPPNAELEGEAEVELVLRRGGEQVLVFALDPNLRVTEINDSAGNALSFIQPRDPKDDYFLGDYLVVAAPEAFPMGPNTLRFRYAGKRVVRKEGAGTFFCRSFGWYPTYSLGRVTLNTNEFATRADFDLTLRVPKKYEGVAVGSKVEERQDGDFKVTRWQSDVSLAVAGFAFGDYKVQTETVGNIEVQVYANKSADDVLRGIEVSASGALPARPGESAVGGAALGPLAPGRLAKVMATEVG